MYRNKNLKYFNFFEQGTGTHKPQTGYFFRKQGTYGYQVPIDNEPCLQTRTLIACGLCSLATARVSRTSHIAYLVIIQSHVFLCCLRVMPLEIEWRCWEVIWRVERVLFKENHRGWKTKILGRTGSYCLLPGRGGGSGCDLSIRPILAKSSP